MLRVLFLWLLALSAAAQAPTATVISPDDRALYGVINRASGRCLDVQRAATTSGAAAVQWEFTHAASQQWRLLRLSAGSEYYRLEARHSTQCLTLEVNALSPPGNTPLVQRPYTGALGQQWRLLPTGQPGAFQLENRLDGRVATLATNDKFNGTALVAARGVGRGTQQWQLFQLQLRPYAGPPYFAAPQPLPALSGSAGSSELQPVPAPDGQRLYFNRTRYAGNTEGLAETGDIWVSRSPDQGRTWLPAERPDDASGPAARSGLNTPQNNALQAITATGGLLLRGSYGPAGFKDEGASLGGPDAPAHPLAVADYYSRSPATGFFLSADARYLLLSVERDDSQGLNDLYVSEQDGRGGYTAPRSLGPVVNSPGYDFAPWLDKDGKTLYFSSYGHLGYGSADIFVSRRLDDTWVNWSPPQNLGSRFNGPGYDGFFALGPDGTAYFSSSGPRDTAPKKLFRTPPGPPPADSANAVVADPMSQPRALVTGRVLNANTGQPLGVPARVQAVMIGGPIEFRATADADRTGYQMSLAPGRYRVTTTAGLLTRIDTFRVASSESRRYDPSLLPATVGTRLELPDILFVKGLPQLIGSSYLTLNKLAESLKENPKLEIRLEGHTDNTGDNVDPKPNQKLSEDRVAEVKKYLVGRGVAESRISTVGFGGSKPKFGNDREETRRLNRRVELVITK